MAIGNRDNFPARVVRVCGERAQYICSNPRCKNPTIGPHSESDKSLKTGEAAHINAAAEGGPRYDPAQTPEKRSSIENAIWLCSNCSTLVDKDQTAYPATRLREWKSDHEDWIRNGGIIPKIPYLSLTTLDGLTLPEGPGEIDFGKLGHFREHSLVVRNDAETQILMIQARVQTPEPIYVSKLNYAPVGVQVGWRPDRMQMIAKGSPGAKVERQREPLPTHVYQLQIDHLPRGQHVEIAFGTSRKVWEDHQISFDTGVWEGFNTPPSCSHYFDGTYQFEYRGATLTRRVFAPISYSKDERKMSFIEVLPDRGDWKPTALSMFS